jgi:hypothetical protein
MRLATRRLIRFVVMMACAAASVAPAQTQTAPRRDQPAAAPYFPGRLEWQKKSPADEGFDAARLDDAVKYAVASESPGEKDLMLNLATTF